MGYSATLTEIVLYSGYHIVDVYEGQQQQI